MYCYTWQDWITIRGKSSVATVTQAEDAWMDLSKFQDVVAWLEVKEVSAGGGSAVKLAYQTAPTKDEGFFVPVVGALTVTSGATVTIMQKDSMVTQLSRWFRWQLTVSGTPTSAWDAVFRIFISANAPGCKGPGMPARSV